MKEKEHLYVCINETEKKGLKKGFKKGFKKVHFT